MKFNQRKQLKYLAFQNRIKFVFGFCLLFFFATKSFSQQVIITPPPLAAGGNPTMIQLMYGILNNTTTNDLNIYLHLVCTNKGQSIADVKSKNFILPPNITIINSQNVEDLLYPVDVKYADSKYLNYGIQTSTLLPGTYQICVTAHLATNQSVVGNNCYTITIENFTAVNLLTPMNNSESKTAYPVFTWSRITGSSSSFNDDIYYTLKIVEQVDEQSPIIAIQSNPAVFKEEEISFNIFQYSVTSQPLLACKKYAWQIEAFQGTGANKRSLIKSEVWSFRISCEQANTKKTESKDTSKLNQKRYTEPHDVPPSDKIPVYSPDSAKCSNYKAEFKKITRKDSVFYKILIANNYTGSDSNFKASSLKIKVKNGAVAFIADSVSTSWNRNPPAVPPNTSEVKWKNNSGIIPFGKTNMGEIFIQNSNGKPVKIIYEWLNKNDTIICTDSITFIEVKYYYEMGVEPSQEFIDISNLTLNIQFTNNYASSQNMKFGIYDLENKKQLNSTNENELKLNSITGLNRLSINLKDFNLQFGKLYTLTLSDPISQYYLNFILTSNNEK